MDISTALTATVSTLRRRPADLLPFYILGAAIPVITRVVTLLGVAAAYVYLETTGRLATFRTRFTEVDLSMPDPETEPEAFEAWMESILPLFETLVDPVVGVILLVTLVVSVVLAILLYAGVSAGQYAACLGCLRDRDGERGAVAGIAGIRDHWLSMLGLYLLEAALWLGSLVLVGLFVAIVVTLSPVLGALVALAAGVGWLVFVVIVRAVFAFAPVVVVVDDVGVRGGVGGAASYIRHNAMAALGYYALAIGATVALTSGAGALTYFGAGSLIALVSLLAIAPALDLVKTGIVGGWRDTVDPVSPPETRLRDQLRNGLGRGWRELRAFVVATPGYHALAVIVTVAGFAAGWMIAAPYEGMVEASIAARLEGHVAPAAALEFFANNWAVALGMAFGGAALGLPAAVSLAFNGVVFGLYTRLEADLVELALFVIPHGIIEIPALFIAGAAGMWLGVSVWRTWRGNRTRADLANALERMFWVLVGVGILLFVAGMIEGFVSPFYHRLF